MSRYGSLFERLRDTPATNRSPGRETCVMASVAAHLSRLLSTRAGSVQMLPDYGLPDLNDMRFSLHETMRQSRKAIEDFIQVYEPRLSNVRVVSESTDGSVLILGFSIKALLNIDGLKKDVVFFAALDGRGMTNVTCSQ